MEIFINYNGEILHASEPIFTADNRGYRFGDGLFETMKFARNKILLEDLHFNRLFSGMKLLGMKVPGNWTPGFFASAINELCSINKQGIARVRLSISRGQGNFFDLDASPVFLIETFPLLNTAAFKRLNLAFYDQVRKSTGLLSGVKHSNYLPNIMAAIYAKKCGVDDCIIFNDFNRICETTTANIFWIKNRIVFTVPISEGPVAGVMRQNLLNILPNNGFIIREQSCGMQELLQADEIFTSSAISGIRSVSQIGHAEFGQEITRSIMRLFPDYSAEG